MRAEPAYKIDVFSAIKEMIENAHHYLGIIFIYITVYYTIHYMAFLCIRQFIYTCRI
jgi:hypothetical protein